MIIRLWDFYVIQRQQIIVFFDIILFFSMHNMLHKNSQSIDYSL